MKRLYACFDGRWDDITDNGTVNGEAAVTLLDEAKLSAVLASGEVDVSVDGESYCVDSSYVEIVDADREADAVANNVSNEDEEDKQCVLWEYINKLSTLKYEAEIKRESGVIGQSNQLQVLFAFYSISLYIIVPFVIQHTSGKIPLWFFGGALSVITMLLLSSLLCATVVQRRRLHNAYPSVDAIEQFVIENSDELIKSATRFRTANNSLRDIETDLTAMNDKRVEWAERAHYSFCSAVILTAIAFLIGLFMVILK